MHVLRNNKKLHLFNERQGASGGPSRAELEKESQLHTQGCKHKARYSFIHAITANK